MKICVCEDHLVFREGINNSINRWKEKTPGELISVKTYSKAEQVLFDLDGKCDFDLFILDIELPGKNGMDLAKAIRKKDIHVPIVFMTGYTQYLQKGYEVNAYRYLLKPIQDEQVFECLDYAEKMKKYLYTDYISFHSEDGNIRVPLKEFMYLSADNHFAYVYTNEAGKHKIINKDRLENLIPTEFSDRLIRCHKGFIINIQNVQQYTPKKVVMYNRAEIPVGRKYAKDVKQALDKLFFGETPHDLV